MEMSQEFLQALAREVAKHLPQEASAQRSYMQEAGNAGSLTLEQRQAIAKHIGATLSDAAGNGAAAAAPSGGNGQADPNVRPVAPAAGVTPFAPAAATAPLTMETIATMTPEQINEHWKDVSQVLATTPKNGQGSPVA